MTERTEKGSTEGTWPKGDDEDRSISKSLIKGLAILACFTPERPVLGISDLADELGGSRSTTHRYACTLVELGYLEQDSKRRYRLGLRSADIGMSALGSLDLCQQSRPDLQRLRELSSQTVSLAILDGAEIVVVERLRGYQTGPQEIDPPIGNGSRLPAHATAMGKLLLALLDSAEQRGLLRELKLTKLGPGTLTSKNALRAQLEEIRREQLALEDEELAKGLRSLAAPIYDEQGEAIAAVAITVQSPEWSVKELSGEFAAALSDTASRISAQIRSPRLRQRAKPSRAGARGRARPR